MQKRRFHFLSVCIVFTMAAVSTNGSLGQPPEDERDQRLAWMTEMVAAYELNVASQPDERLTLRTPPVFRWTNPIRDSTDGAVFLWTSRGRPQAMAGVFTRGNHVYHHEFQSLALEGLVGKIGVQPVWNTGEAGVEFRPIPESPVPAKSAAARLRQMKTVARQFSSTLNVRGRPSATLRLLPQPIYRYGNEDSTPRDGALFVFSMGTDPETMLLIETAKGELRWNYAFARMSWAPVAAQHKEQTVWKVDYWDRTPNPSRPYIVFKNKIPKGADNATRNND